MVVGQAAELLVHTHEFVRPRVGLREPDGRCARTHGVIDGLPDFPRRQLGDVLVGRQALHVDFDLWAGRDAHVVDQRTSSGVAHALQVFDDLGYTLTPERAGALDERGLGVGLLAQRVIVEHRLDDIVAHHPDVGVVLAGLIGHIFLGQTPLAQHLAADFAPELQSIELSGRLHVRVVLALLLVLLKLHVLIDPRLAVADLQHFADGVFVVARNADEVGQLHPAQGVVLEQVAFVDRADPRLRVDVERIDPLILWPEALDGFDHSLAHCVGLPPQRPLAAHNRPLDERRRERHKVGDEIVE